MTSKLLGVLVLAAAVVVVAVAGTGAKKDAPPFPLNHVDSLIGTGGVGWTLGQNNPGAQHPFGALRLGPDTSLNQLHVKYGHYNGYAFVDTHVRAFSHTHVVGAGLGDWATFGVMALRSAVPTTAHITRHGYRSEHSHETEEQYPGYYSTYLITHSTLAELVAAGTHAGVHRYTFDPASGPATLLIDVAHSVSNDGDQFPTASIKYTNLGNVVEVDAVVLNKGSLTGRNGVGVWVYLHAKISSTSPSGLVGAGLWYDGAVYPGQTQRDNEASNSIGAYFNFGNDGNTTVVTVEAGISFVSPDHARANQEGMIRGRSFDAVLADTTQLWVDTLAGTAVVESSNEIDLIKFYTSLYRTYMSPTNYAEIDGSYLGKDDLVHTIEPGRQYYSDLSLWDTYRTQNPWLHLIRPDVGGDVANSLVLMFQQGKGLSRWPIANVYTSCMFGDNANMLFIDAYRKDIRNFNITEAYTAMYLNAMAPQPKDGRGNIEDYILYHYIPIESKETGTSNTLNYAYNDWAIAEFAQILGLTQDEAMFRERATYWRNVFSTDALFMCARHADGEFECPDYRFNNPYDDNFVEGNTWHYTWDVPHDLDNFLLEWPSPEAFVEKLEYSFNQSTIQRFLFEENWLPNPYYWAGNEHDLLFPWEFIIAGRADLTQYWVRWLLEHRYSANPDGLPGNDDYGTMSAWYTFGALGLYPITGFDYYFISSPNVEYATIKAGSTTFTVRAINHSAANVYIESVTLNGVALAEPYITHAQLTSGNCDLVFTLTSSPNGEFNTNYASAWRAEYEQRRAAKQ